MNTEASGMQLFHAGKVKKNYKRKTSSGDNVQESGSRKCFRFHSVEKTDLNFSYYPSVNERYGTHNITITSSPIKNRFVVTLYTDEIYPPRLYHILDEVRIGYIERNDPDHHPQLHKRLNPLDKHYHLKAANVEDADLLLKDIEVNLKFSPTTTRKLYQAGEHFSEHPLNSRLIFKDNSYVENGGASSLQEGIFSYFAWCNII